MPGSGQPSSVEPSTTRASSQRGPKPTDRTRESLINVHKTETDVLNATDGRTFLERGGYLSRDNSTTINELATILLQLTQCTGKIPRAAADGMRAVALLMVEIQAAQTIDTITNRVLEALTPAVNKLADAAEEMRAATISQAGTMEEFRNEAHEAQEAVMGAAQELADQVERSKEALETQKTPTNNLDGQPTYAAITQVQTPPGHAEVIARTRGRERQVLIEWEENAEVGGTAGLTERELVAKANLAVELMGLEENDRPGTGDSFIGAQRLRRGGILYLMASTEAADWVRQPETRQALLRHIGGIARLRDRGHIVIMEFVPTRFSPEDEQTHRAIETTNQLPEGEILSARWLKEVTKRAPGQRTAFALLTLRTAKGANQVLKEGIVVEGKRVYGRKNNPEARRCLKCQGYQANHIAAECKQIHDTCARCAKMHATAQCDSPPSETRCSNCNKAGHTASARECPIFIKECTKLLKRRPENKYRYFPTTEDPTSWELVETTTEEEARTETQPTRRRQETTQDSGWTTATRGTARGWNGGARGGRPGTTSGSRPKDFVPPPSDNGWTRNASQTQTQAGTQRTETTQNETAATTNPTPNAAGKRQTTLENFMTARPIPSV